MGFLGNLLGGGQGQGQQYQDFVQRYEQGAPWEGISDQEAVQTYQQVAPQLSPDVYQSSAQQAFSQLSPDQRGQLGQFLAQHAQQQGLSLPFGGGGASGTTGMQDPGMLAQVAAQLHQQQPGLLGQLLGGGGGGGMLSGPIGKAALAGIAAMAVKQMTGR